MHGGATRQALAAAEDRLKALVHPAITGLAELINNADSDSVRLSAIRDLLDRTGYKPSEKVETSGETTIRYVNDWRRSPVLPSSQFEVFEQVGPPMAGRRNGGTAPDQ